MANTNKAPSLGNIKQQLGAQSPKISVNFNRNRIANYTILAGYLIILIFIIGASWKLDDLKLDSVFQMVVPLIATWVGTVMAFYFGQENFRAASQQLAMALDSETIDDIPVENVMISRNTIVYKVINKGEEADHKISELVDFLEQVRKDRLPILDKDLKVRYIMHKSSLDAYLAPGLAEDLDSLQAFLDTVENQGSFSYNTPKGFVMVAANAPLEKAIEAMKTQEQCKNVFVSASGNPDEPIIGWVTDAQISRYLNLK